jgi:hypothetical protein
MFSMMPRSPRSSGHCSPSVFSFAPRRAGSSTYASDMTFRSATLDGFVADAVHCPFTALLRRTASLSYAPIARAPRYSCVIEDSVRGG